MSKRAADAFKVVPRPIALGLRLRGRDDNVNAVPLTMQYPNDATSTITTMCMQSWGQRHRPRDRSLRFERLSVGCVKQGKRDQANNDKMK
eukprot:836472-Amphidinium_carterae.1